MSEDEIRRRKTNDPEVDAMVVIAQALAPLDVATCERVLKWAMDRFIEQERRAITETAFAGIRAQLEAVQAHAKHLGVKDHDLVHAISHVRSKARLAPIDDDEHPDRTEDEAVKQARAGR